MKFNFKKENNLEKRKEESGKILSKYPDRIPIIVERLNDSNKDIPEIDKKKIFGP
jgi:GABA(A) receptor-associated protein